MIENLTHSLRVQFEQKVLEFYFILCFQFFFQSLDLFLVFF